jgi:hypothetical protein
VESEWPAVTARPDIACLILNNGTVPVACRSEWARYLKQKAQRGGPENRWEARRKQMVAANLARSGTRPKADEHRPHPIPSAPQVLAPGLRVELFAPGSGTQVHGL